ncbi:MAG: helix-turn-helix domain-containing protein [Treponema sp.]|nr:helix-turn-helix domain-containing protein [Treponema sp.]
MEKVVLTVDEAAQFLKLKKSYIYKLIGNKKIPFYRPGGRRIYFKPSDLEAYVFRNRQAADYEGRK